MRRIQVKFSETRPKETGNIQRLSETAQRWGKFLIVLCQNFIAFFVGKPGPYRLHFNLNWPFPRKLGKTSMRPLLPIFLLILLGAGSCNTIGKPVVDIAFTDSLLSHYQPSPSEKLAAGDLDFWKKRLDSAPGAYTALLRVSGGLAQRFHLYGDMADLLAADSILNRLNLEYKEKEAGILRSLASLNITRHRFKEADEFVQKALAIGSEKYASTLLYFDTQFELGSYVLAEQALRSCAASNEYGYFFRLSKWKHLQGETDSAVFYMQKAADWAGTSLVLKQTALSNMADLYMHEGELKKANDLYTANLKQNAADYHSLQGVGRIALMKDNNSVQAEKIFRFIPGKNKLPDAVYNLEWVAEQKSDSVLQKQYAGDFVKRTSDTVYGGMYNKYLIELFTGILQSPDKALAVAEKEINNRSTPQTNAWLAWTLHKTGNDTKALEIYKAHVSGKPLEALELYWMGKMMKDLGKNYNASEFFKAANKNLYDLSPAKQRDLKSLL